jgi:hypothetical protein
MALMVPAGERSLAFHPMLGLRRLARLP